MLDNSTSYNFNQTHSETSFEIYPPPSQKKCISAVIVKCPPLYLVHSLLGSFSISVLSGKLMFRDVLYVTKDLTFRYVVHYDLL